MKKHILLALLLFYQAATAQIAITEVYYDTPYFEGNHNNIPKPIKVPQDKHHLGEFIELYNYSTEDISLDGWRLADNFASIGFPKGTVIKSGDFLILAYRNYPYKEDYFPKFFPNTRGQESKIIYQDGLMLGNFKESLKLYAPVAEEPYIPYALVDKAEWADPVYMGTNRRRHYVINTSNYNTKSADGDGSGINYYAVASLQKTDSPQENYYKNEYTDKNTPNPLTSLYKPEMINFYEAPGIVNAYKDNYALITWAWYINQILNNTCSYDIPLVEQSSSQYVLTGSGQCFGHDAAGNISAKGCLLGSQSPNSTQSLQDNPEQIKNRIQVYPNPTSDWVTLTWDQEVDSLIAQMRIVSLGNAFDITVPKNASGYTYSANLSLQPAGIYILSVTLVSGQTVSKNIIKL